MTKFQDLPTSVIPPKGLIAEMISCWRQITESPDEFLLASAISSISSAAGDQVFLEEGSDIIYLNLWQLLVGCSTTHRKSTALRICEKTLRATQLDSVVFPRTTIYGLIELARDPIEGEENKLRQRFGVWIEDEFQSFYANMNKDFNKGLKDQMLSVYDSSTIEYFTKGGGYIKGQFTGVSILSATTPYSFSFTPEDFGTGFFARWNFFITDKKSDRYYPFRSKIPDSYRFSVIPGLKKLRSIKGPIIFEEKAKKVYSDWYLDNRKRENIIPQLVSFFQRNEMHVKKYAAIFALSDLRITVSIEDLMRAIELISWQRTNLETFLQQNLKTKFQKDLERILEKITRSGDHVTRSALLRDLNFKATDLDERLDTLIQSGQIKEEKIGSTDNSIIVYRHIGTK